MARTPIKRQAGPPGVGDGYELSTYVDQNGNLWVTGALTISGLTLVNGNLPVTIAGDTFPVTIAGTPTVNLGQVSGTAITLGQKASAASLPVVLASDQSPLFSALPSITNNTAPLNSTSTAYETSRIVKPSPGVLFGVSGFNSKVSAQYIALFDATQVPANGAAPVLFLFVASNASFSFDFGRWGRRFNAGIVVANSSTATTLTIGSADIWTDSQYV